MRVVSQQSMDAVRAPECRPVRRVDKVESFDERTVPVRTVLVVWHVVEQSFYEVRRRDAVLKYPVIEHIVPHVLIDADRPLEPLRRILMFGRAVVHVLLREVYNPILVPIVEHDAR